MAIEGKNITFFDNLIDFVGKYSIKVRLCDQIDECTDYDWTVILSEKIIEETFVFDFDWESRDKKSVEKTQEESER